MAFILFHIKYGFDRTTDFVYNPRYATHYLFIKDRDFAEWVAAAQQPPIDDPHLRHIILSGYFQLDVYRQFRTQIWDYMCAHPNDVIFGTEPPKYKLIYYSVRDLCAAAARAPPPPAYDIVIHIRLEDFINVGAVIHPACLDRVVAAAIDGAATDARICFLCNAVKNPTEINYARFFQNKYPQIVFESNDVATDFHIMLAARILVCSLSSMSWCAALLSSHAEIVYLPEHPVFRAPHENTVIYPITRCGETELAAFFSAAAPAQN